MAKPGRRPAGQARPGSYQAMYESETGGVPWDTKTMQGKSRVPEMPKMPSVAAMGGMVRGMMQSFMRGGKLSAAQMKRMRGGR